jgi:hypothetical protein
MNLAAMRRAFASGSVPSAAVKNVMAAIEEVVGVFFPRVVS